MKLKEAVDLFFEIDFNCSLDKSKEGLHVGIDKPNSQDGYRLLISSSIVPESSHECIKSIAEKHKLKLASHEIESQRYLAIYTH
jgi:hypothetical protein